MEDQEIILTIADMLRFLRVRGYSSFTEAVMNSFINPINYFLPTLLVDNIRL